MILSIRLHEYIEFLAMIFELGGLGVNFVFSCPDLFVQMDY